MQRTHATHPSITVLRRLALTTVLALGLVSLGVWPAPRAGRAQEPPLRLNKVIEALEAGRPAIANREWRFVDMEHSPFSGERVQRVLAEMNEERDPDGRLSLTPLVRIPQEGDEDFKWAIKQVLDLGGMGIILPHVDRAEEAMRLVRAMRYPPARGTRTRHRGASGVGPGGATRLWGLSSVEYARRADVWPLNPEGELFAVAMIESQEAVNNIHEILLTPVSAIMVIPGDMAMDSRAWPQPARAESPRGRRNVRPGARGLPGADAGHLRGRRRPCPDPAAS